MTSNTSKKNDLHTGESDGTSLSRILDAVRGHRRLIRMICALAVLGTTAHYFAFRVYPATSVLLVQSGENSPMAAMLGKAAGGMGALLGGKSADSVEKYLQYMKSHEFHVQTATHLLTKPEYANLVQKLGFSRDQTRGSLKKWFFDIPTSNSSREVARQELATQLSKIVSAKRTGADNIMIKVAHRDPDLAVELANAIGDLAEEVLADNDVKELSDAKKYIEEQLQTTSSRLGEIDNAVVKMKTKTGIQSKESLASRITQLQRDVSESEIKYKQNAKLIQILSDELSREEKELFATGAQGVTGANLIANMRQQIESLKKKKSILLAQGFSEKSREVLDVNEEIDDIGNRLQTLVSQKSDTGETVSLFLDDRDSVVRKVAELKRENQHLGTRIEILNSTLAKLSSSMGMVPQEEQIIQDLKRKMELEYLMYADLKKQLFTMDVQQISVRNRVRLLEKATLAGVTPPLRLLPRLVMALFVSFIFGALFSFILDEGETAFKTRSQFSGFGLPVLANLPEVQTRWTAYLAKGRRDLRDFINLLKTLEVSEPVKSYSAIRDFFIQALRMPVAISFGKAGDSLAKKSFTHVRSQLINMDSVCRVIAVTSAKTGEGKSFVTANLARAFASLGKKTLIIDCGSPVRPITHDFGLPSGETNTLKTDEANLEILSFTGGPESLTQAIAGALGEYDQIIIDTPALNSTSQADHPIVGADHILMVITQHETRHEDVLIAMNRLTELGIAAEGRVSCVFNKINTKVETLRTVLQAGYSQGISAEPATRNLNVVRRAG